MAVCIFLIINKCFNKLLKQLGNVVLTNISQTVVNCVFVRDNGGLIHIWYSSPVVELQVFFSHHILLFFQKQNVNMRSTQNSPTIINVLLIHIND